MHYYMNTGFEIVPNFVRPCYCRYATGFRMLRDCLPAVLQPSHGSLTIDPGSFATEPRQSYDRSRKFCNLPLTVMRLIAGNKYRGSDQDAVMDIS